MDANFEEDMNANFENELIEVILNACPEGKEKEFKAEALRYWKDILVTELIESAFED